MGLIIVALLLSLFNLESNYSNGITLICDKLVLATTDGKLLVLEGQAKDSLFNFLGEDRVKGKKWVGFQVFVIEPLNEKNSNDYILSQLPYVLYPELKHGGYSVDLLISRDSRRWISFNKDGIYQTKLDNTTYFYVNSSRNRILKAVE